MPTPLREWPNVYGNLRDDMSEMVRKIIKDLEEITKNKVNSEEEVEAVAAEAISNLNIVLRALERAGASTDPITELSNKVREFQTNFDLVRV